MVSYADSNVAYSVSTSVAENPMFKVIKFDIAAGTNESYTVDAYSKCNKLSKYLGANATDATGKISGFSTILFVNGVWIGYLSLSSTTSKFPGIESSGALLPSLATMNENVYCAYDLVADKWLVEPDLENPLCGVRTSGSGSTSTRRTSPNWAWAYGSSIGGVPQSLDAWKSTRASQAQGILGASNMHIYQENQGDNNAHFVFTQLPVGGRIQRNIFGTSYKEHNTYLYGSSNSYGYAPGGFWHKYNTTITPSGGGSTGVGDRFHAYRTLTVLDQPITKTSEYTMKLTYTIQYKVPDFFAEPGHEYDYIDSLED